LDYVENPWFKEEMQALETNLRQAGFEIKLEDAPPGSYMAGAPIIMLFAVGFAAAAVATGFFGKVGEDLYEAFKNSLKNIAKRAKDEAGYVDVRIEVTEGPRSIAVRINQLQEADPTQFDKLLQSAARMYSTLFEKVKNYQPEAEAEAIKAYVETTCTRRGADYWRGTVDRERAREHEFAFSALEEVKEKA
jgi:hypothetical protein